MEKNIRHKIIFSLVASYMLLGILGHLEVLTILGFGTNPQHLEHAKSDPSATTKVYWTQHKHTPSNIKISVPSPAVLALPEEYHTRISGIRCLFENVRVCLNPVLSLYTSRAPPVI